MKTTDPITLDKGTYLADLEPGQSFGPALFAVRSVTDRGEETRAPQLAATLTDRTQPEGRIAKVWQADDRTRAALKVGQIVQVWGKVDTTSPWAGELTLERVETIAQPEDLSEFLAPRPEGHTHAWKEFCRLIRSVQNPYLAELLKRLWDKQSQCAFADAVAARGHHHAYRGGLLQHTVEVAALCEAACAVYPYLCRDLLITGALLHDFGKLTEMEHGLAAGAFTAEGCLIGHVHGGALRVREVAVGIEEFPLPLLNALMHLILSHHGEGAFGSPKTPAFPEAVVLSQCDRLSAHTTAMHEAICKAPAGVASLWHQGNWIYTENLGDTPRPAPPLPSSVCPESQQAQESTTPNNFATARCIPVRGLVAAGRGEESAEYSEETLTVVPPEEGADYLVRVTGESLQGAGVQAGDLLFVQQHATPHPGDLVVAWLPGQGGVVKRFAGDRLESAHPDYPPIPLTEEVRIQGKVTGLLRPL
ncbi:S24 family peptidase [Armatimonas sp.]|uniref:S24 family peptidase n=1 Tax=Armatimonas sp. TaxID=1872638 RepID=UPI00374DCE31